MKKSHFIQSEIYKQFSVSNLRLSLWIIAVRLPMQQPNSCIFQPCDLLPTFPLLHFPPLRSRFFHSCIFQPCIFDRIIFSTPAFSVAPSWGQTGHEWAIHCRRSWCFCVAIMQCSLMFCMPIVCLYGAYMCWHWQWQLLCVKTMVAVSYTYVKYVFGIE